MAFMRKNPSQYPILQSILLSINLCNLVYLSGRFTNGLCCHGADHFTGRGLRLHELGLDFTKQPLERLLRQAILFGDYF